MNEITLPIKDILNNTFIQSLSNIDLIGRLLYISNDEIELFPKQILELDQDQTISFKEYGVCFDSDTYHNRLHFRYHNYLDLIQLINNGNALEICADSDGDPGFEINPNHIQTQPEINQYMRQIGTHPIFLIIIYPATNFPKYYGG